MTMPKTAFTPRDDAVVHEKSDASCCTHYGVDDPTFVCEKCGKRVGYCMGGDDDELCADCWCKVNGIDVDERERLAVSLVRFTGT